MAKAKINFDDMDLGLHKINADSKEHELLFKKVSINQLDENSENNKIYEYDKDADDFLKQDINRNGILNPIIIIKNDTHAGRYTIVSGHRRTRIAKELGVKELEAREIIARTPQEKAYAKIMLITANSTQRDRKPTEKAKEIQYLKSLIKECDIDNVAKWISKATKMSERNVYRYEKLAKQPNDVQGAVDRGEISVKQAIGEESIKKKRNTKVKDEKKIDFYKKTCKLRDLTNELEKEIKKIKSIKLDEKSKESLRISYEILQSILDEDMKNND